MATDIANGRVVSENEWGWDMMSSRLNKSIESGKAIDSADTRLMQQVADMFSSLIYCNHDRAHKCCDKAIEILQDIGRYIVEDKIIFEKKREDFLKKIRTYNV